MLGNGFRNLAPLVQRKQAGVTADMRPSRYAGQGMTTDAQVLAQIDAAFGDVERPEHFTDYAHCCECAEHDALLRARDRDTLCIADVGNTGWDPSDRHGKRSEAGRPPVGPRSA
jgi:hypothetical protein